MSQFRDYVERIQGEEGIERLKRLPRMEEATIIEKPCFVTDIDGDCFWIDPIAKTITRIE